MASMKFGILWMRRGGPSIWLPEKTSFIWKPLPIWKRPVCNTTVGETEVVLNAVDLGIAKYVVKPVNLPALNKALFKLAKDLKRERKEPLIGEAGPDQTQTR